MCAYDGLVQGYRMNLVELLIFWTIYEIETLHFDMKRSTKTNLSKMKSSKLPLTIRLDSIQDFLRSCKSGIYTGSRINKLIQ